MSKIKLQKNKGFAMLFAVMVSVIIFTVALGVMSIALKETRFSISVKDSNSAFLAADTGAECALFGDNKAEAFPISVLEGSPSETTFSCLGESISPGLSNSVPCDDVSVLMGADLCESWKFTLLGLGNSGKSCANIEIIKASVLQNNSTRNLLRTNVISKGYNLGGDGSCNSTGVNLAERILRVIY